MDGIQSGHPTVGAFSSCATTSRNLIAPTPTALVFNGSRPRTLLVLPTFRPTVHAFASRQVMATCGRLALTEAIFTAFWPRKNSHLGELGVQTAKFTFSVDGTARDSACGLRPTKHPGGSRAP